MKSLLIDFIVIFFIAFIVTLVVGFLYNLLAHGAGVWNITTATRMAIIFGLIFTFLARYRKHRTNKG